MHIVLHLPLKQAQIYELVENGHRIPISECNIPTLLHVLENLHPTTGTPAEPIIIEGMEE